MDFEGSGPHQDRQAVMMQNVHQRHIEAPTAFRDATVRP